MSESQSIDQNGDQGTISSSSSSYDSTPEEVVDDYDLMSSSDSEEPSHLSEDAEVDLLTRMNREDLFMYIKSDPGHYLNLIHKKKLCSELNILISRNSDNLLSIKFRIFPEDRWTEVGFSKDFENVSDEEVYRDFVTQCNLLLTRTRGVDLLEVDDNHLQCQLEGNNNMQSPGYGHDLPNQKMGQFPMGSNNQKPPVLSSEPMKIDRSRMTSFERSAWEKMQAHLEQQKKKQPTATHLPESINESPAVRDARQMTQRSSSQTAKHPPENLKESVQSSQQQLKDRPVDTLNRFVAGILDKIIQEIPNLVKIDKEKNYKLYVTSKLKEIEPPENYKKVHQDLICRVKGCEYIQKVHHSIDWNKFPELSEELLEFHKEGLKHNPNLYLNIDEEKLTALLDDDDRAILEKYNLHIQDLWRDYLKNDN